MIRVGIGVAITHGTLGSASGDATVLYLRPASTAVYLRPGSTGKYLRP